MLDRAMRGFRQRRVRARLSSLAIMVLLWSQFVLAAHPVDSMADLVQAAAGTSAAIAEGCHHPRPTVDTTICDAHCSQGDPSDYRGRVPPVHALAAESAVDFRAILRPQAERAVYVERPPAFSWHRPTSHPASLLLI